MTARRAGARCGGYRVPAAQRRRPVMDLDDVLDLVLLAVAEQGSRPTVEDRDAAYHAAARLLQALGIDVDERGAASWSS